MTRDYLTMPFWLYLALGYSLGRLVYGGQRPTYLLVGIVLTGCAVFSFTRSYAICALGTVGTRGLLEGGHRPFTTKDDSTPGTR